jgi:ligand-binding sensor domain-containing protein/ribonucleotide reductase beta subunit family protein with ferritin-like domain
VRFSIILLLLLQAAYAQEKINFPAGIASDYELTAKDGWSGFNYSYFAQSPGGIIYAIQYNGIFTISGNNWYLQFDTLQKMSGTVGSIKAINDDEAWAISRHYIAVFKNKVVDTVIHLPFAIVNSCIVNGTNKLTLFEQRDAFIHTWIFDGKTVKYIGNTNQPVQTDSFPVAISKWFCSSNSENIYFSEESTFGTSLLKYNFACNCFTKLISLQKGDLNYIYHVENDSTFVILNGGARYSGLGGLYNHGIIINLPYNFELGSENSLIFNSSRADEPLHIYKLKDNQYFLAKPYNKGFSLSGAFENNNKTKVAFILPNRNNLLFTSGAAYRLCSFVKKYPRIYNNQHSANIFTVKQDDKGDVWAGSYQGYLSIFDRKNVVQLGEKRFSYMNGGSFHNGYMYLIGEGKGGLIQFDKKGNGKQVIPSTYTGYSTFISKNGKSFYYGTPSYSGLWQTSTTDLEKLHPKWNKIDSAKGSLVENILTIAEDTLGRIWYGAGKKSLAIYNPKTDKATTWLVEKNETPFGAFSSVTDKYGTLWIGSSNKGLWYYSDYSKPAAPSSFKKLVHFFLNDNKTITALTVYNNWLVIGATDKILLLNTDSLYLKNKIILRYLNPQEVSINGTTEQNTFITSYFDSTVWFSTTDMLYQWDIKNWLAAPVHKVKTELKLTLQKIQISLLPGSSFYIDAYQPR